jgi:hypothetical protein
MPKLTTEPVSPNANIDAALDALMDLVNEPKDGKELDVELQLKVINAAMTWVKIKHRLMDKEEEFDPDAL